MAVASPDNKNKMALAISSGFTQRVKSAFGMSARLRGVSMIVGSTAFTRTPAFFFLRQGFPSAAARRTWTPHRHPFPHPPSWPGRGYIDDGALRCAQIRQRRLGCRRCGQEIHSELLGPSVEPHRRVSASGSARDIGETVDLAEARGHRLKGLLNRRESVRSTPPSTSSRSCSAMLLFASRQGEPQRLRPRAPLRDRLPKHAKPPVTTTTLSA